MITIYEANNSIDAHLIKNLLQQAGIHSYIHGAPLLGGIGDLPTSGLVRVLVDESNYKQAKEVIQDWEQAAP